MLRQVVLKILLTFSANPAATKLSTPSCFWVPKCGDDVNCKAQQTATKLSTPSCFGVPKCDDDVNGKAQQSITELFCVCPIGAFLILAQWVRSCLLVPPGSLH